MIHFLYLVGFAIFVGAIFGAIHTGDTRSKTIYGLKIFGQFLLVSIGLAWIFYFIPW